MLLALMINADMVDPFYGVNAGAAAREELEKELEEEVKAPKRVTRIAKGVPVYRVEFPEYPTFEAKMWEFKYQGDDDTAKVMKEMLARQRDRDEEEAIIALLH